MRIEETVRAQIQANFGARGTQPFFNIIDSKNIPHPFDYRGFTLGAARAATVMKERGIGIGDHVLICMSHQTALFLSILGVIHAGGVPVVLTPPNPKISHEDYAEMISKLVAELQPSLTIVDEGTNPYVSRFNLNTLSASAVVSAGSKTPIGFQERHGDAPILIQYSSGTTGLKKGVEISETALLEQVSRYSAAIGLDEASSICSWLPLYHDMGLICCFWTPLLTAVPTTHMSPFDWLAHPEWFLRRIEESKATHIWLPNFAYSYMARWYKPALHGTFDLSSLRMITNCSEPVTHAAQQAFIDAFANCGISERQLHSCYAMAETTFAMTTTRPDVPQQRTHLDPGSFSIGEPVSDGDAVFVSSGVPIADTEFRVVGNDDKALEDGHFGSIQVRSPSLMSGYYKMRRSMSDDLVDGFFATGDLGVIRDGHLFVTGRKDDMIIAYGANYDPVTIEEALWDLEGVIPGRGAAIGVSLSDPATSDIVILLETHLSAPDEIADLVKRVKNKILSRFNFIPAVVETLPHMALKKSSSGKISRKSARKIFFEMRETDGDVTVDTSLPLDAAIAAFLRNRLKITNEQIEGGSMLSSGLLDSLAIVDLILFLEERIGKSVPSPLEVGFDKFESISSIRQLAERIEAGDFAESLVVSDGTEMAKDKVRLLQKTPDIYRSFTLSSSNFKVLSAQDLDHGDNKFFNFYLGGASLPDYFAAVGFFLDTITQPIDTLVIGLDIDRIAGFLDVPCAAAADVPELSKHLSQYLGAIDYDFLKRREENIRQRRLNLIRFGAVDDDMKEVLQQNGDSHFIRNGAQIAKYQYSEHELKSGISAYFNRLSGSRKIGDEHVRVRFEQFRNKVNGRCRRILFVIPPYHPQLFKQTRSNRDVILEINRLSGIINELFAGTATVIDLRDVTPFGGDPEDFLDATHGGPTNGVLAARIIRAYLERERATA
ncbi:AMP-binding protein [Nisaea acidiphila]|uniref:AMP-binding protein n=1 Tax=Nisaea acidiphila TaxID=1862145 RepID=A0A9J7AL88_9PROT|nr:AMP-binding protein [Nisaea acidiphila]UUX48419.1 AMP-binding protein [Nisaea acidiphila]